MGREEPGGFESDGTLAETSVGDVLCSCAVIRLVDGEGTDLVSLQRWDSVTGQRH